MEPPACHEVGSWRSFQGRKKIRGLWDGFTAALEVQLSRRMCKLANAVDFRVLLQCPCSVVPQSGVFRFDHMRDMPWLYLHICLPKLANHLVYKVTIQAHTSEALSIRTKDDENSKSTVKRRRTRARFSFTSKCETVKFSLHAGLHGLRRLHVARPFDTTRGKSCAGPH